MKTSLGTFLICGVLACSEKAPVQNFPTDADGGDSIASDTNPSDTNLPDSNPPELGGGNCDDYSAPVVPAPTRTFYVDSDNGNDANDGSSPALAWQTLTKANGFSNLNGLAGDEFVLSGTFSAQKIQPFVSGTADAKVVYRAAPGATVVIDTGVFDSTVVIDNVDHIVVEGIETTAANFPIVVTNASYVWLRSLNVHNSGGVRFVGTTDGRIEDSTFTDIGFGGSDGDDAIVLRNGSDRNVIVRNTFLRAKNAAINLGFLGAADANNVGNFIARNNVSNAEGRGLLLSGKAEQTLVECNRVHDTADGTGTSLARSCIDLAGLQNTVRFNELYDCGASVNDCGVAGITLHAHLSGSLIEHVQENHVHNNSMWRLRGEAVAIIQADDAIASNNIIENNLAVQIQGCTDLGIVYSTSLNTYNAGVGTAWATSDVNGNILRHNLVPAGGHLFAIDIRNAGVSTYSLAQAQSTFSGWAANQQADALLTDTATNNAIPQVGSPSINTGNNITGVIYQGPSLDIGAYERP